MKSCHLLNSHCHLVIWQDGYLYLLGDFLFEYSILLILSNGRKHCYFFCSFKTLSKTRPTQS